MSAEQKFLILTDVKAVGEEGGHGYLEGYGAVKHNIDSYGDVIADGAFVDLDEFEVAGFMGDSHYWDRAIGYIVEAREDSKGLWVKMAFHSTPDAQNLRTKVRERLEAKKKVGLSIGYFVKGRKEERRDGVDVRVLTEIEVFEISIVTMPANVQALVAAAKGKTNFYTKGNGVPLDAQFDFLTAEAADLSRRLDDIAKDRPAEWREEKAQRLITIADTLTQAATAVKSLNGADEPEELPENWEQILADAQKHLSR